MYLIRYNHQLLVLGLANDQLTALDQACHCPATTEEEPRPMGQRLPGPLFLSPPGLFHRVEHWLREKALPYQVRDQRLGKPGDIDRPDWTLLYPLVAQKLKAVLVQNENGVILAPTGSGKSRIVATLLDYIGPTQTGVVIGGSTTETLQLYAELKKLCPYHKFGLRTGVSKTPPERVMVTTVESAAKAVDLTKIAVDIIHHDHHFARLQVGNRGSDANEPLRKPPMLKRHKYLRSAQVQPRNTRFLALPSFVLTLNRSDFTLSHYLNALNLHTI